MDNSDIIICTCAEVSKQEIINTITKFGSTDINIICDETGAGLECGGCRPVIQEILKHKF